ncbi:methylated-DNA--[protein]-cysteine S-methyltransferase [Advenella mimigardefordensis]|uniref:Methylated-DNA--protein-cysteine methyltransferase n=1 Tax=Advenella mimigardefordensis (strain DSM 17166 / LMG 22922 / DPN7) TaxID=1247726 RepID=W0PGP5_ADVMD|nr:methylated-DNA--[protein]-cysteine S-methyltransferase [Advenella mimigardefordensis]AHG64897.1 putative methyltransferase [Advenella mimigardefordensis DPN7]
MLNNELFPHPAFTLPADTLARLQGGVHALGNNRLTDSAASKPLYYRFIDSPVGPVIIMCSEKGVVLLEFLETIETITKEITDLQTRYGFALSRQDHPGLDVVQQQIDEYFSGRRQTFALALDAPGTAFDETVWAHLQRIPYGRTCSYGALAREIGNGAHARIVGSANHRNRISIVIPCHRVIGADGSLTGYGGGLPRKRWLLEFESVQACSTPLAI